MKRMEDDNPTIPVPREPKVHFNGRYHWIIYDDQSTITPTSCMERSVDEVESLDRDLQNRSILKASSSGPCPSPSSSPSSRSTSPNLNGKSTSVNTFSIWLKLHSDKNGENEEEMDEMGNFEKKRDISALENLELSQPSQNKRRKLEPETDQFAKEETRQVAVTSETIVLEPLEWNSSKFSNPVNPQDIQPMEVDETDVPLIDS